MSERIEKQGPEPGPEPRTPPGGAGASEGRKASDEEWKRRAEEEKKKLDRRAEEQMEAELPPASFVGLLQELSMRALVALGQIVNPLTGDASFDLPAARYTIDLLAVLEAKTKGNLSPQESGFLSSLIGELRIAFVEIASHPDLAAGPPPPPPEEGTGGKGKPKIII
jgi:hypothetical protein